jgi:hypothetical protein
MRYEYSSSFRPVKIRVFFFVFLYGVAANIPFWIASRSMGLLMTGLFNVEFLIIGILSVLVPRKLTVGLLLAANLLDIVRGISVTYRLSPSEMLRSIRYLSAAKSLHLWDVVVVAICIVLICLIVALASGDRASGRERRLIALTLAGFVLFCGVADVKTGQTTSLRGDSLFSTHHLTRFPAHSLVMSEWEHDRFKGSMAAGKDASVLSASTKLAGAGTTPVSRPSCAGSPIMEESPALCSWYQLEFNVHRSVAELAMREAARPAVFLVVGDHAPPFSSVKPRGLFSDAVVPYVLLEPKVDGIKEALPKARLFAAAMRLPARMHRSRFRGINLSRASDGQ